MPLYDKSGLPTYTRCLTENARRHSFLSNFLDFSRLFGQLPRGYADQGLLQRESGLRPKT